jgi:hypothetical protein
MMNLQKHRKKLTTKPQGLKLAVKKRENVVAADKVGVVVEEVLVQVAVVLRDAVQPVDLQVVEDRVVDQVVDAVNSGSHFNKEQDYCTGKRKQ